ncbi:MAG: APC family permease [Chloroflexi bacterium]|nr:APC family permease [Chloroflexota bacterium]
MSDERDEPTLEQRIERPGRRIGDRYVRIVRPPEFRRGRGGTYVATPEALAPRTGSGRFYDSLRRLVFGRPLTSESEGAERLSKKTGLGVLASDNISSSAYATEEAMRILALAGASALALTMPVAIAIAVVLAVVVLSQTQVIRTYPGGGGSYAVAKGELGMAAGVVVASALLLDYVLTVAVSIAAGVAAIGSFVPAVYDDRVVWGLALIALLAVGNLRGIREAGIIFSAPTYVYLVAMAGMLAYGIARVVLGDVPAAAAPPTPFSGGATEALTVFLILRAFASGSVALTGAEAVANGTPSLKPPEARNGVITVLLMGTFFGTIFLGITFLATRIGALPDVHEAETLNSVLTRSLVGVGPYYYLVQVSTAVLLILAANTGFTGFPRLASVLADDRFMPRQFAFRGERLAFSTGIVALAVVAAVVLVAFGGSVTALIPLYTIGVFLAFTLAQSGLLRRWYRRRERGWQARMVLNGVGATATGVTLVVVATTKFTHGAWIVLLVLPLLVLLLFSINKHYRSVADALTVEDLDEELPRSEPPLVVVPVARLDRAALRALAFASSMSPDVRAVHIATSEASAAEFRLRWDRWLGKRVAADREIRLDLIQSPFRALLQPLLRYIDRISEQEPGPVTVLLAEYVPRRWWEFILHSQTALRLKAALLFRPDTVVIDVPYHFRSDLDVRPRRSATAGNGAKVPRGGPPT